MDETMPNPNVEVRKEVEDIKGDVQKLRNDLTVLVGHLTSYGKDKLADTRERFGSAVESFRGRASGQVQQTRETARREGHQAVESSRKAIKENPLTYAAIAFCAGMLLSSTGRRKRR
jgi:ElaB/YqjD/DUF883 family membrane-anchored ribosome-binding protein